MPLYTGFIQLGAGLSVGLAGLAAGFAIGIVGDAGVRGTAQQPRLFVGMVSLYNGIEVSHSGRSGGKGESTPADLELGCMISGVKERLALFSSVVAPSKGYIGERNRG